MEYSRRERGPIHTVVSTVLPGYCPYKIPAAVCRGRWGSRKGPNRSALYRISSIYEAASRIIAASDGDGRRSRRMITTVLKRPTPTCDGRYIGFTAVAETGTLIKQTLIANSPKPNY